MKTKKQFLSIWLILCMLFSFVPQLGIVAFAVEELSINLGQPQRIGEYFCYNQAAVTGTGLTSIVISFSESITPGDSIVLPASPDGFTVSPTSVSNDYAKRINLSGVTSSQVQEYLRQIKFSIGGERQTVQVIVSTENVSHDTFYNIDTQHYYQFIPVIMSWTESYETAKSMTYMGRTGYLATITNEEEDVFVNTLSGGKTGWLGGSILKPNGEPVDANNSTEGPRLYYSSFDTTKTTDGWYWVCGPEIGTKFYDAVSYKSNPHADTQTDINLQSYYNWAKGRGDSEPNTDALPNSTIPEDDESCLTTLNIKSQGYIGKRGTDFSWNDLKNSVVGAGGAWSSKGYFVEYGNLPIGDTSTTVVANSVTATAVIQSLKSIYVSSSGSDTGDGSLTAPFASLNKAFESVTGNSTIYILDDITLNEGIEYMGNHNITITSCDSSGNPIVNAAGDYTGVRTITRGAGNNNTMFMFADSTKNRAFDTPGPIGSVTFRNIIIDGGSRAVEHNSSDSKREDQGYIIYTNLSNFTVNLEVNSVLQNNINTGSGGSACGGAVCLNRVKEFNMTDNAILRGNVAPRHGGAITMYGGIINMSGTSSIYGNGIEYSDSFSPYYGGGAVLLYADFGNCVLNLSGFASITDNYVNLNGGSDSGRPHCSVMAQNEKTATETINISGNAKIYGNRDISYGGSYDRSTWTLSGGSENNLYAKPGFLNISGALGTGAKVGITLIDAANGAVAAKGTGSYTIKDSDVAQLFYDAGGYSIVKNGNNAVLTSEVEHLTLGKLEYDDENNQITGYLNVDVPLNTSEVKVLINGVAQNPTDYSVSVSDGQLIVSLGGDINLNDGDKVTVEVTKNGYSAAKKEIIVVSQPTITIISPEGVTESGNNAFEKTVDYATDSVNIEVETGPDTEWAVYWDEDCTELITQHPIPLEAGNNTFYIKAKKNGFDEFEVFTLTIYRKNNVADLAQLTPSAGVLSPEFDKDVTQYSLLLKGNEDSVTVTPKALDCTGATVKVNNVIVPYGEASSAIAMAVGANQPVTITVIAEDESYTKTYTIIPTRLSGDNKLGSLTISDGTLSPQFGEDTIEYSVDVSSDVESITLFAVASDIGIATILINGKPISNSITSLPIDLKPGINVVEVTVVAEDGTTKTYTLTINKALEGNEKSANNNLSSLSANEGVLIPSFNKNTDEYTLIIDSGISDVRFMPTAEDIGNAKIKVNGVEVTSGNLSEAIALAEGQSTITITVEAENGEIKTYKVNVKKADSNASGNADLSGLTIEGINVSQTFDMAQSIYTANVGIETDEISVSALAQDENATIIINGQLVESGAKLSVPLKVGANTISVVCVAEDGTIKEYTLIVNRYSNRLLGLVPSVGTLSPAFDRDESLYSIQVDNSVSSFRLIPYLERLGSIVTINGAAVANGQPSQPIELAEGSNTISIAVTAEDGTEKTYNVFVYRKAVNGTDADAIIALIKSVTDQFGDNPTDEQVIEAKGVIEACVVGYNSLDQSQAANVPGEQKLELFELYDRLLKALKYVSKVVTQSYSVEVTEGFVSNLDSTLVADDGETLTLKLNVIEVAAPKAYVLGKKVVTTYDISISEYVTRNSDGVELARKDNIQPKDGKSLVIKIKVPSQLKGQSGLDVVYIDADGNAVSQNAVLAFEGGEAYLIFNARHFSRYAIVYTEKDSNHSKQGGFGGIRYMPADDSGKNHKSYINGYEDSTFRPDNSITRAEAAVIFARVSGDYNANIYYTVPFSDVEANGWYLKEVGYSNASGLLKGYSDGTFNPSGSITRAEFSAIIARFLKLDESAEQIPFSDASGHWAEGYISVLYKKGIITGYEDGAFLPNAPITRAEAVKLINHALGRTPAREKVAANISKYHVPFADATASHWAYYDILEAAITHADTDFN